MVRHSRIQNSWRHCQESLGYQSIRCSAHLRHCTANAAECLCRMTQWLAMRWMVVSTKTIVNGAMQMATLFIRTRTHCSTFSSVICPTPTISPNPNVAVFMTLIYRCSSIGVINKSWLLETRRPRFPSISRRSKPFFSFTRQLIKIKVIYLQCHCKKRILVIYEKTIKILVYITYPASVLNDCGLLNVYVDDTIYEIIDGNWKHSKRSYTYRTDSTADIMGHSTYR